MSISFYLSLRFSSPGKQVYVIALTINLMFDFFWKEFFLSIGTILGSDTLWILRYLWYPDSPWFRWNPESPANMFYYRLFLFKGGRLSVVCTVFTVFNGLVERILLLILLYYPYLVIIVRLSWKIESLFPVYYYRYPLFFRFLVLSCLLSLTDLFKLSLWSSYFFEFCRFEPMKILLYCF